MPRLILHIGQPKAGSSTIQKYIRKKREKYKSRYNIDVMSDFGEDLLYILSGSKPAIDQKYGVSPPNVVVTSSELLWSKLKNENSLRIIKDFLFARFRKVQIILYLRRQDEIFVSGYYTRAIKNITNSFPDFEFSKPKSFDFYKKIEMWDSVFGRDSLTLRPYAPGRLLADDIIQDFCWAAKIPYIHTYFAGANISPAVETIEFIRMLFAELDLVAPNKELVRAIVSADIQGTRLGLSAADREEIISRYQSDNDLIAQHFLGENKLFSHLVQDDGIDYPCLSTDQIAWMTQEVLRSNGKASEAPIVASDAGAAIGLAARRLLDEFGGMARNQC